MKLSLTLTMSLFLAQTVFAGQAEILGGMITDNKSGDRIGLGCAKTEKVDGSDTCIAYQFYLVSPKRSLYSTQKLGAPFETPVAKKKAVYNEVLKLNARYSTFKKSSNFGDSDLYSEHGYFNNADVPAHYFAFTQFVAYAAAVDSSWYYLLLILSIPLDIAATPFIAVSSVLYDATILSATLFHNLGMGVGDIAHNSAVSKRKRKLHRYLRYMLNPNKSGKSKKIKNFYYSELYDGIRVN